MFVPLTRGASDPDARRADMDEMGVDQTIVYPTVFTEYLPLVENPDVAAALARAYNDWIWEFCSGGTARLIPVAVLPLQSVLFSQQGDVLATSEPLPRVYVTWTGVMATLSTRCCWPR